MGMGGVGKTQIAAALVNRLKNENAVDLLVWVPAASRDGIITTYARAAHTVEVGEIDPDLAAANFVAWLGQPHRRRWIVVLDDVTDPADLAGLWPPVAESGRTIVTSRRRDHAMLAGHNVVDVGAFDDAEAVRYLCEQFGEGESSAEAAALAADLGHLPLALAQAAAYIADRGLTCARYRARLARRRSLADLTPDALPDGHQHAVAAAWQLSIELANELRPIGLAKAVLELMALLDPNGVPLNVLAARVVTLHVSRQTGVDFDAEDVFDALHNLRRLSLATVDEPAGVARVHALVQRATREATPPEAVDAAVIALTQALLSVWPETERDAEVQILRASVASLRQLAGDTLWKGQDNRGEVLFKAGSSLGFTGQVSAAASYFDDLVAMASARIGTDHRDTLYARYWAAYWLGDTGDITGAISALTSLLVDQQRVLGPDREADILSTQHELGYWYGRSGDTARAVRSLSAVLPNRIRVIGDEHEETLQTRSSLAYWRGRNGDVAGALADNIELLADRTRILGPEHPKTVNTRHEIAYWRGCSGDFEGAVEGFTTVLHDRTRSLGAEHPETLSTRHSLAYWRGRAGDPIAAVAELREVLADRQRVMGEDNPATLTTRHALAYWTGHAEGPAAAVTQLEAVLADRRRVLGPDDPDTLLTHHELGCWRHRAGQLEQGIADLVDVHRDRERVLGPVHPDTCATRAELERLR